MTVKELITKLNEIEDEERDVKINLEGNELLVDDVIEPPFESVVYVDFDWDEWCEVKGKLMSSEWIPVSERLPENGNRVIVTNKDGQVFINSFWDHFRFFDDDEIIAWQPLPEPYKKGGAE